MDDLQIPTQKKRRPALRVAGLLTMAVSLVLIAVGTGSFLIHLFSHTRGGLPWLFSLCFIGWAALFVGAIMVAVSFRKAKGKPGAS